MVLSVALLAGCAAFGVAANEVAGVHTMPAKWVPPQEPTLVLVEQDRTSGTGDPDCRRLTQFINHDLETNKVVPLISDDKLTSLRDADPNAFAHMSIAALGRAVGAKQVIYVSVMSYGADTPLGSNHIKYTAAVHVKVVDTETGESRWPRELTDGQPLNAESDFKQVTDDAGVGHVRDDFNELLAEQIGKLFHPWMREHDEAGDYEN
jgi:hypothetical protein